MAWANRVRHALSDVSAEDPAGIRWHLLVDCKPDSVAFLYDNVWRLVGTTAGVIFIILTVAFRSPVIAIRSLLSLAALEVRVVVVGGGESLDFLYYPLRSSWRMTASASSKRAELLGIRGCYCALLLSGCLLRPSCSFFLLFLCFLSLLQICVFGTATAIYCQGVLRDAPGALDTFSPDLGLFWLMPLIALPFTGEKPSQPFHFPHLSSLLLCPPARWYYPAGRVVVPSDRARPLSAAAAGF